MQEIVRDFLFVILELEMKIRKPSLGQMIRFGRNTSPQKRDPVLVEDHKLGADILDGVADIIDDNTL